MTSKNSPIVQQAVCFRLRNKKVGLAVILIKIKGRELSFVKIRSLVKKTLKDTRVHALKMKEKDVAACLQFAMCLKFNLADKNVDVQFTYGEPRR